ncbi:hypothetical protein [Treponema socranskii]|uniref:hypothetical protein n=1 Tax=Treponema socranskii TaxID=53419 RepID=UPI003D950792
MADYKEMSSFGILNLSINKYKGKELVYHIYLGDKKDKVVILSKSFSLYRSADVIDKKIYAWANRQLHWFDIKKLKHFGYLRYDWGGYNIQNDDVRNISIFKKEFGGTETDVYEGTVYRTTKAKLLRRIIEFKAKF